MSTMTADTKTIEAPPQQATPAAAEQQPTKRRGKKAFFIFGAVVLVGLGVYGAIQIATRGKESTDDAQVDADVVAVAARVPGKIVRVPVQDNQRVQKADVIAQIEDLDYAAKAKQAEAELLSAKAQASQAEAQEEIVGKTAKGGVTSAQAAVWGSSVSVQSADAQIAAAKASLDRAQVEARNADTELARYQALRKDNAVPQAQLDAAQTAADAAHAALTQAQANVAASEEAKRAAVSRVAEAQGHLTQTAPPDLQQQAAHAQTEFAHARVASAEAALALAKLQLDYTKIVAPEDGWISRLSAREGQLVTAGTPLGELVPDRTYVIANFKETQIGDMHVGERAEISIDAYPHRTFEGKVESLSAGTGARFSLLPPDNASGNFVKVVQRVPVRIAFVNPPGDVALRAGLSADVTVYVK